MAEPITWRNVTGPSLAEASRPLLAAQQSFGSAFDGLNRMLEQRQAVNQRVYDDGQQSQMLGVQELLQGADTPEAIAALKPQIDAARAAVDPAYRKQMLGIEQNRLNSIWDQSVKKRAYEQGNREDATRPVVAAATALAANGDNAGALARLQPVMEQVPVSALSNIVTLGNQVSQNKRAEAEERQRRRLDPFVVDAAALNNANAWSTLQKAQQEALRGKQVSPEEVARFTKGAKERWQAYQDSDDTIGSQAVQTSIFKEVDNRFKDKDEQEGIKAQIRKVVADPANAGLRRGDLLNLISAAKANPGSGVLGLWADKNLTDTVATFRESDDFKRSALALEAQRATLRDDFTAYNSQGAALLQGGGGAPVAPYRPGMFGNGQPVQGSAGQGAGYDTVYGYGQYGQPPKPVSQMTIGETMDFGRTLIDNTKGTLKNQPASKGTSAMGKYQFTQETLADYGPRVFGDGYKNVPMTPENQDRLAEALFNDRKNGNLKGTWEGLPDTRPGAYKDVPWSEMKGIISQVEGTQDSSGQVVPKTAPVGQSTLQQIAQQPAPVSAIPTPATLDKAVAKRDLTALKEERYQLEQAELSEGLIKKFSPETEQYLKEKGIAREEETKASNQDFAKKWLGWLPGASSRAEGAPSMFSAPPGVDNKPVLEARRKALESRLAQAEAAAKKAK